MNKEREAQGKKKVINHTSIFRRETRSNISRWDRDPRRENCEYLFRLLHSRPGFLKEYMMVVARSLSREVRGKEGPKEERKHFFYIRKSNVSRMEIQDHKAGTKHSRSNRMLTQGRFCTYTSMSVLSISTC